jgi:hypothetical protein
MTRSSLSRHWHAPLSAAERASSRRRVQAMQARALADDVAVIVLDEVTDWPTREMVANEARRQAGIAGGRE